MEETEYHEKADLALAELLEFCEGLEDEFDIEVELQEGILSIIMQDEKEYVINKHTPTRQIWISSPYSGASYFEYKDNEWLPRRANAAEGRNLRGFIKDELRRALTGQIN